MQGSLSIGRMCLLVFQWHLDISRILCRSPCCETLTPKDHEARNSRIVKAQVEVADSRQP